MSPVYLLSDSSHSLHSWSVRHPSAYFLLILSPIGGFRRATDNFFPHILQPNSGNMYNSIVREWRTTNRMSQQRRERHGRMNEKAPASLSARFSSPAPRPPPLPSCNLASDARRFILDRDACNVGFLEGTPEQENRPFPEVHFWGP